MAVLALQGQFLGALLRRNWFCTTGNGWCQTYTVIILTSMMLYGHVNSAGNGPISHWPFSVSAMSTPSGGGEDEG